MTDDEIALALTALARLEAALADIRQGLARLEALVRQIAFGLGIRE